MSANTLALRFDFSTSNEGWSGDFADYPVGEEAFFELGWGWDLLPAQLCGQGVRITGNNHSDDLFMFIYRPVSGLLPSATYIINYKMVIATNAPTGCVGVGGAPGESVYVKVGASTVEPMALIDDGYYRMNIDKGNQSQGGQNAVVVGNLANGDTDCTNPSYRLKKYSNESDKLTVTSDKQGRFWLFVGTDSGFEATSTPYYSEIEVSLTLIA